MLKRRWLVEPTCPPEQLVRFAQYPPLVAQILYNRGIADVATAQSFFDDDAAPGNPFQMTGMSAAVDRLRRAIRASETIAVYGDFDADGVTATALLVQTLTSLSAQVMPYIPHRVDEGYGLNPKALHLLKERGARVVVTVDCGVRSIREVAYGRGLGLDVIVTDHHSVGNELPPARAIINPKQLGDKYPFKEFSGAGLAFKLAQALFKVEANTPLKKVQPERGRVTRPVAEEDLVDLVALGTVADLVPLIGENRALVKRGIKRLNATERPGLIALMEQAGARSRKIDAGTIGFFIGPRLNAAGRMAHARTAYDLLTTQYPGEAQDLAAKLEATNRDRQAETEARVNQAREQIAAQPAGQPVLIAASPEFPEGVIGLVASKLSEETYRPAIAIHLDAHESRGSARSIPEFNIVSALDECADLLVRHGGHAAAAGFTVKNEKLDALCARLKAIAARELGASELVPTIHIDYVAQLGEMNWVALVTLDKIAPYGYGNREPLFLTRGVIVKNARVVGSEHLSLTLSDGAIVWDGIAFRQKEWASALAQPPIKVNIVYTLASRTWGGEPRLQLEVKDLRIAD